MPKGRGGRGLSYLTIFSSLGRLPTLSPGRLWSSVSVTAALGVQWMMGGSCVSSVRLQSASPWHQRCWNCSRVMAGCLPLSQWLSTPARSLMSDPTKSQSRRMWSLAAAKILAAMCDGVA